MLLVVWAVNCGLALDNHRNIRIHAWVPDLPPDLNPLCYASMVVVLVLSGVDQVI